MTRGLHGDVTDIPYLRDLKPALDGPEEIRWLALPCGTALEVNRGPMSSLCDG